MKKWISDNLSQARYRKVVVGGWLLIIFFLAIFLKSGYYHDMPFLPDGDTYYPGMMAKYIVATGQTTTNVPFEVPVTPNGAPLVFPILVTQIHFLSNISLLAILRWFGPVISAFISLSIFVVVRRILKSETSAMISAFLSLIVPLFSARLSSTFPESIIILFIPVVLLLLEDSARTHKYASLLTAFLVCVSAIGYHFVSYLLWPMMFIGIFTFFVGRHWKKRNLIYIGVFIGGSLLTISLLFSNWWLFGFLQSLLKIYSKSAITGGGSLSTYALPAPTVDQWYEFLGFLPVILATIGIGIFFFSKRYAWRIKVIIGTCFVTILLPLQILPALQLFSYTPWRAFVYITPFIILFSVVPLVHLPLGQRKHFSAVITAVMFLTLLYNYTAPVVAGAGEQQLTKGEYTGIAWLRDHADKDSVIVTAPANGRQVVFLTNSYVAYDTGLPVFNAITSDEAVQQIALLGSFKQAFIYISKYKLGPVYNFGWVREYANVKADLTKFEDKKNFSVVFEDADSVIYALQK